MTESIAPETLRLRKQTILGCGVLLYFLTSMSKVLIPATIFNDLQRLGLDAAAISATGAAFMYAYAASQLLAGVFADRYGGVRILLIGGSLFAAGSIAFPLTGNLPVMLCCRALTGFGAGTVFLGVAKLLNDLFPEKFAPALGLVLLLGYFGPTAGTVPMTLLIRATTWRWAMALPGAAALAALIVIVARMSGTIKPTQSGQTLQPLFIMMRNRNMWLLCLSVSVIFGAYYGISSQFGQKSLMDFCALSREEATTVIMVLTIVVACNNLAVNFLLKLCGDRRKVVIGIGQASALAGSLLCLLAFRSEPSLPLLGAAYVLISFPAGFFPVFGIVGKELNPPEHVGLAVAMVNFWCFVAIAGFQNINGCILRHFAHPGVAAYPPEAYANLALFLTFAAAAGLLLTFFYPETGGRAARK
ncbi:MAG: MFS transporter [Lentisphaeria bacterium]|nr:MFS transporter [Lentisphaeria bacterium]